MLVSYNGWPVIPKGNDDRLVAIPKIAGRVLKGDVEFIFRDLVEQIDIYVEDVDMGKDDWGYANKLSYGSTKISCHASGTAIDVNALLHPIGRRGTFTAAQVSKIENILKRYSGVIVWGGHWKDRPDDMHFEISGSRLEVADSVTKLKKDIAKQEAIKSLRVVSDKNKRIQRELRKMGLYSGAIDGVDGKVQRSSVKKYQTNQKAPFKLVADGVWGNATEAHFQWVMKLQKAMNDFGKPTGSKLLIDGDFSTVSVAKIKTLQAQNKGRLYNGVVDGKPGPIFCKMIGVPVHP